ncbi:MAG TPA: DinB family protein [Phototrophicaceae bacterium]|nr:DinB family protein [Phototrophicaceae bacterium]
MNRFMQEKWSWIEGSHGLRNEVLDTLTDADLGFNPGGKNLTLGALLRELGEIEYSYEQSLKTFKQDWAYRNTASGLDSSVSRLKTWFQQMDADMQATVAAFSDEDLKKPVDRGGYEMPVETQLEVYLQALLIVFGKIVVYFRAMDKPLSKKLQDWIG